MNDMKYFVGDDEFEDFSEAIEFSKENSLSVLNEDGVPLMVYTEVPIQIKNEVEEARKLLNYDLN